MLVLANKMSELSLNTTNYDQGYLVDEQWIGWIVPNPELPSQYLAFVIAHSTGETLGMHQFNSVEDVKQLFTTQGIEGEVFEKAFNSVAKSHLVMAPFS